MKMNRRISLIIILLGLSLLLGILFHSFILENLIKPVALVFWVFRRMLLSVNQKIYWGLLIFSAVMAAFFRSPRSSAEQEFSMPLDPNATLKEINSWRSSIWLTGNEIHKFNILKQNLGWMLASLYAPDQPGKALWEIYEALKQRQSLFPGPYMIFCSLASHLAASNPSGRSYGTFDMLPENGFSGGLAAIKPIITDLSRQFSPLWNH